VALDFNKFFCKFSKRKLSFSAIVLSRLIKKEGKAWTAQRQKAEDTKRKKSKATDKKFRPY
jgi:hypothetical protein